METSPTIDDTKHHNCCEEIQTVTIKCTTFRNYWVKFQNEKIEIGRQGETSPLLSFTDRPHGKEEKKCNEVDGKKVACGSVRCQTQSAVWKKVSDGIIPKDAFPAGNDPNCALFVGRASHEDDLLPGKICLANKKCYVPWGGGEYTKTEYEVLTGDNYKWVPFHTKAILVDAVPGGMTKDGTTLYIGRTTYNNTLTPGKVYPWTGLLYIPYAGLERTFSNYDILVFK